MNTARTPILDIVYEESGPADGHPVVLMHGFPDDGHAYDGVAPPLAASGYRVIVPYLRGYGPTRFLGPATPRSGQQAALGHDLLDLIDALDLKRPILAGYDWGGRAACIVAALWPERVGGLVTIGGYNIQNIANSGRPQAPAAEYRHWYGSLTVWFTEEAIAAWRAEPRTTRGGQPHYSALAIATALTLRAVFRLALRQTEGLIGSIIRLLGLDLAIPDHSTLSRRAETLAVARPPSGAEPVHLLVDSTGLKLSGAGEWLVEKHGTSRRRSWRKLHIGVDANTGQIVAAALTTNDADDGAQVGPLLDQIDGPIASFTGDGAYDQDGVYGEVAARHPDAPVIVPPRSSAVPSETAETAPTQRDRHLQVIAEHGRMGWQKASGYNWRALVEADIGRWKRVIGHALRSQTDERQATEVAIAVDVLNRMLELGRPSYVRIA